MLTKLIVLIALVVCAFSDGDVTDGCDCEPGCQRCRLAIIRNDDDTERCESDCMDDNKKRDVTDGCDCDPSCQRCRLAIIRNDDDTERCESDCMDEPKKRDVTDGCDCEPGCQRCRLAIIRNDDDSERCESDCMDDNPKKRGAATFDNKDLNCCDAGCARCVLGEDSDGKCVSKCLD